MPARSWVCPTDADVQRFYEALPGINRGRRQVVLILLPGSLLMTTWLGVPNLALIAAAATVAVLTDRLAVSRGTTAILSGLVISVGFQIVLSAGVAATGGLDSPYLAWLSVPVTMLAARYRRAVFAAALLVAFALGALACLVAHVADTGREAPAYVQGLSTMILMCALGVIALNLQSAEIESRREATSDALTGLLNRKALAVQFRLMGAHAIATGGWIGVVLCDLDHFKSVNDTHGHAVGDDVLRRVAAVVQSCVRPQDRVFRYGGEELLVLLPDADRGTSAAVAERIRRTVEETPVVGLRITLSAGVAAASGAVADERKLLEAADKALYTAKSAGRNRVELAHPFPA